MKKVEQIINGNVIKDEDIILNIKEKFSCLFDVLSEITFHKKYYEYGNTIILLKQITYLGNPHDLYKKRIQIPKSWLEIYSKYHANKKVVFLGVYKYKDTTLFVDFDPTTYVKNKANNSSAHVYTLDLLKGLEYGIFEKRDKNNNKITVITPELLEDYINGGRVSNILSEIELINISINELNKNFEFNHPINALTAQKEMYDAKWKDRNQCEWPGFYLEYFYDSYIDKLGIYDKIRFIAQKKKEDFDYDLFFPKHNFYGDLKTSDITKKESPGNDLQDFEKYFRMYNKFWYLIYEHETVKSIEDSHETLKQYNKFKYDNGQWAKGKAFNELSYSSRFKKQVTFKKMMIIEINSYNKHLLLNNVFKQGKQTDGSKRKEKFLINKKDLDNFVIYRYFGG